MRPKMADLPEFRFPDANKQYPFVNTGMDMFGPFCLEDRERAPRCTTSACSHAWPPELST